jgi:hypothetical protein
MSIASPFESNSPPLGRRLGESLRRLLPAVRVAGFWSAVFLPFLLAGLVVTGAAVNHPVTVSLLLAMNVLGLALGRNHNT